MSKKRTSYSAEFKTRLVLEVLKNERTLNEIASSNNVTPKNIQNWKKTFLDNAEIAMEPSRAVKEYKKEIENLKTENETYAKIVGKLTVERDWLTKKVRSLDSSKEHLVTSKLPNLSITRQCELIGLSRSKLYYKPRLNEKKTRLLKEIHNIFKETPIYGYNKVRQKLLEKGYNACPNTVAKYRKELGLKAFLAVRAHNTSIPNKLHEKYPYKLSGLEITRANQVWSTDITYIKTKRGYVYLAAIIDWYSKAVLASAISNTMDKNLVLSILDKALSQYGKPDIFNTDQGSVYTSSAHTRVLSSKNIIISMDGKGRATDNIAIERFWRSAKCERIYLNEYTTIKELQEDIDDYIRFYNYERFHQTLNYEKPMNVYQNDLQKNNCKAVGGQLQ